MKLLVFTLISLNISQFSFAQIGAVDVADLTIKINATGEEELFYGFAAGDQIVFSFEELKGKSLKEIEIIELPNNSKYMDFKTDKVEKKIIRVNQDAIYQFKFNNSAISGRICKVHIQRIPKDEGAISFNTNWDWKTLYDTIYTPYTEDSLVGYDTLNYKEIVKELIRTENVDEMILDKTQRVHSYWNDNSSYTYLRVDIPQNKIEAYREERIVSWAYWVGVGEEASEAYAQNVKSMGEVASGVASVYGTPLAGIAVGALTDLLIPKNGEDVKYAFISNFQNVQAFLAGQPYYQFDQGKGVAAYGKNSTRLSGTFYIGLYNDNKTTGIDANIKIVVIKEIKTYQDIEYDRQRVTPKYLKLNKIRTVVKTRQIKVNAK